MNEISEKLLQKLLAYAQNIETFTKAEVPAYIQELLDFKFMEHLVNYFLPILILAGILGVIGIFSYILRKPFKENYNSRHGMTSFMTLLISGILAFVFLVQILCYNHLIQAYKIKTAPRVYIIDYLKGEIK